jgi:hypothetical protein
VKSEDQTDVANDHTRRQEMRAAEGGQEVVEPDGILQVLNVD